MLVVIHAHLSALKHIFLQIARYKYPQLELELSLPISVFQNCAMRPQQKSSVAHSQLSDLDDDFRAQRFNRPGGVQRNFNAAVLARRYSIPRDRYDRLDLIDYDHWAEVRAKLRSQGANAISHDATIKTDR
jgi:hypothetical protein